MSPLPAGSSTRRFFILMAQVLHGCTWQRLNAGGPVRDVAREGSDTLRKNTEGHYSPSPSIPCARPAGEPTGMLRTLTDFIAEIAGGARESEFAENDYRLAAAALLVHVVTIDGVIGADEMSRLRRLVAARHTRLSSNSVRPPSA